MEAAKWWSDRKGGGSFRGPNDSGICTFSETVVQSMVREVIQNSLDADKIDISKPTIVKFKLFTIPEADFPSVNQFKDILQKCLNCDESNRQDYDIQSIFNNALDAMNGNISVLKISDFNTVGLEGSNSGKKGTSWSRLTMDCGSANSNSGAQGSFGIGKSAPFACSALRTVFYSSLDKAGIKSTIGVARLVSYKENDYEDSWTTGELHWTNRQGMAVPELLNIDNEPPRTQSGTDIYIMGMCEEKNMEKKIVLSVVMNFLVSIWNGKLEVFVGDKVINSQNLGCIIDELYSREYEEIVCYKSDKEDRDNLKNYYSLLNMSNKKCHKIPILSSAYGSAYGFEDYEATLYLLEGDDLNRRILITRKAGMKLFEQGSISGSISFTGILTITGDNMNREFRKMEVASHDKWVPAACKDKREKDKLTDMYGDLRRLLRNIVRETMVNNSDELVDAFGVNEFLPSDNSNSMDGSSLKEKLLGVPSVKNEKDVSPAERRNHKREGGENSGLVIRPGGESAGRRFRVRKKSGKGGNSSSTSSGISVGLEKGFQNLSTSVKQSLVCLDRQNGKYLYQFISPSNKKEKLSFYLNGEQFDARLEIEEIGIMDGAVNVVAGQGNTVILTGLRKGKLVRLNIKIPFDQYCKLEVEHYEAKK